MARFRPLILSRHPSHNILRAKNKKLPLFSKRSIVRFGSSTIMDERGKVIINSVDSIKTSANKLLMKKAFHNVGAKTADWKVLRRNSFGGELTWCVYQPGYNENMYDNEFRYVEYDGPYVESIEFPIVAKAHYGSKGKGNTLIRTKDEFDIWAAGKNLQNYIFEKFVNYALEYRLHVSKYGCFYTCRKALRKDCPEDQKWRHHDDTCVWFLETNPSFRRPNSWDDIVKDCQNALEEIGADILSFDVKVQSETDRNGNPRDYQKYILLESNSASSMNNGTDDVSKCAEEYIKELTKLIYYKIKNE